MHSEKLPPATGLITWARLATFVTWLYLLGCFAILCLRFGSRLGPSTAGHRCRPPGSSRVARTIASHALARAHRGSWARLANRLGGARGARADFGHVRLRRLGAQSSLRPRLLQHGRAAQAACVPASRRVVPACGSDAADRRSRLDGGHHKPDLLRWRYGTISSRAWPEPDRHCSRTRCSPSGPRTSWVEASRSARCRPYSYG